jgi:hypothetical protein
MENNNDDFGPEDWGVEGYDPPKTCLDGSRSTSMGIGKRQLFTEAFIKQKPNTEPCKYSQTLQKSQKEFWLSKNLKFPKAKRETNTSLAMKRSRSTPGPGHYSSDSLKLKPKSKLGFFRYFSFSYVDRGCFLDDVVAKSQQVPSSHKYRPVLQPKQKLSANPIYHKPYLKPAALKKDVVGPGVYQVDEAISKFCMKKSSTLSIAKSKRDCFAQTKAKQKGFVPGAGTYSVVFNNISFVAEKNKVSEDRQRVIKKNSKVVRITDKVAKDKDWVPGPGTYYNKKKEVPDND